jgi:hypothetical protein
MLGVVKIMDAYFSDLERDLPLSSEALYWLARLREKKPLVPDSDIWGYSEPAWTGSSNRET